MNKAYQRINDGKGWENFPSTNTPLDKDNLNKGDVALDEIDNRVIVLDTTKFDKLDAMGLIKNITFDLQTGILTKYYYNGSTEEINTGLSKVSMNLRFDSENQILYIINADGTEDPIDLSVFITNYEFEDSDTIAHNVSFDGKVKSVIKEGSIEEKHLRPDYLADIRVETAKAAASASAAEESETNAKASEDVAKASEIAAKASEDAAAASELNVSASATSAAESAATATAKSEEAANSATSAEDSANAATEKAEEAANSASAAASSAESASDSANDASASSTNAAASAVEAESYAHGGTNTREGEDTDNAKEYARQAKESAESAAEIVGGDFIPSSEKGEAGGVATLDDDGKVPEEQLPDNIEVAVATTENAGIVKPDGDTITVDEDGTIRCSAKVDTATTEKAGIVKPDGETITIDEDGTIHAVGGGATEKYFGFIEHMDIENPSQRIEYIGENKDYTPFFRNADGTMNLGSWSEYHVLVNNRPAMVGNDGVPKYYLDPTNYNKKEDGTTNSDVANSSFVGDAMSWIDLVYKSEYLVGKDRYVKFSQEKLDDTYLPNGFIDNGNVLSGVWIPMFYPTLISNKIRSLSTGYPHVNTTAAQELTLIDAIGGQAESISGALLSTIADLMIMWAKTTNTQEVYGLGNCNGYNASDANKGKLPNQVVGGGQFYGTSDGHSVNKILHSMLLGTFNVWIRDPYTICDHGTYKVSKDYAVRDLGGAGYENGGPTQQTNDWQKEHLVVNGFGSLPSKAGGSSATCVTDYYWIKLTIVSVTLRLGSCSNGLMGGARVLSCDDMASASLWHVALAFILKSPTYIS